MNTSHLTGNVAYGDLSDSLVNDNTRLIFQWIFYAVISQFIGIFGTVTNIINIICFIKMRFKDPVNISLLGNVAYGDLSDSLVNDNTRLIFQWIFYAVISQFIGIFGTVTNIINIICFTNMRFNNRVNISLLGLAASDLGCLVTLIWTNICYNPAFNELDLPFDPVEVQYLTGAWPHASFTRITSCITAFITLERCLCISTPLKVKSMITPKRVTAIIISIFAIFIISISPLYYVNRVGMKFSPLRNKTLLGLVFTEDRDIVDKVCFTFNSVFLPLVSFFVVIISTIVLVLSLRSKAKWRETSTASGKADSATRRDKRVAMMIASISILFIVCFLPVILITVAVIAIPGFHFDGKYRNTVIAVCSIGFTMESANSASNIFIYYRMSSKYRETFWQVMLCRREEKKNVEMA